jgi:hypothetical protein
MRIALAVAIGVWTLAAWGGRIGLLTSGEGWGAWLRIGGSLVVGLLAVLTLTVPALESWRKPALLMFAVFTIVLWVRSLIVTWTGSGSLPFKLVHTVLDVGFFALAWWALSMASSSGAPTAAARDDAHGSHLGSDEAGGETVGVIES